MLYVYEYIHAAQEKIDTENHNAQQLTVDLPTFVIYTLFYQTCKILVNLTKC